MGAGEGHGKHALSSLAMTSVCCLHLRHHTRPSERPLEGSQPLRKQGDRGAGGFQALSQNQTQVFPVNLLCSPRLAKPPKCVPVLLYPPVRWLPQASPRQER